jgi:hypothetical protein
VAVLAGVHGVEGHVHLGALGRLLEGDLDLDPDVAALDRARTAAPSGEGVAPEEGVEDVAEGTEAVRLGGVAVGVQPLPSLAVVDGPAVGVRQHLVGLGGLLELGLRLGVIGVDVGMQLAGQHPEGLLDRPLVGAPLHPEDLVGVALHSS